MIATSTLVRKCMQGVNAGKPGPCPTGIGEQPTASDTAADNPLNQSGIGKAGKALAAAEKIQFSDEEVGEGINEHDYDAIEATMTVWQRRDMEEYLKTARDNFIDEMMSNFKPDIDEGKIAEKIGFSDRDVKDDVGKLILEHVDDEDEQERLIGELGEWYNDFQPSWKEGDKVVYSMFRALSDMPDDLKDAVNSYVDDAAEKIRDAIQDETDEQESDARQQAEYDYDEGEDRVEYLRQFYRDNPDQMSGRGEQKDDTWYKDSDGDSVLKFTTSAGTEYSIKVIDQKFAGESVPSLQFSDEEGRFSVTGRGHAFEVFGKVTAATTAYVMKNNPPIVTFTAQGESRQSLYDKLVKTVSKALPEYSAIACVKGNIRHYAVVKRSEKEAWLEKVRTISDEKVEELVKAFRRKCRTALKSFADIPNYRKAEDAARSCETCSFFRAGESLCTMFDAKVEADMVCDEWAKVKGLVGVGTGRLKLAIAKDFKIPDKAIYVRHFPDLRQTELFSCGAIALECVAKYSNVGGDGTGEDGGASEAWFIKHLGTTAEDGTPPPRMIDLAKRIGLKVVHVGAMTASKLKAIVKGGVPVIVLVQAWLDDDAKKDGWDDGHYVVAIGFDKDHVYFEDPSLKRTRGYMMWQDFERRWHDVGADGTKYVHWGLALAKGEEKVEEIKAATVIAKGGFTGERRDRAGRRMCYRDGKRVPCAKKPPEQASKPDKGKLAEKVTDKLGAPKTTTELVNELRDVMPKLPSAFGDRVVWIGHAYNALKEKHPHLTREDFNRLLLQASQERKINLSRADLVQAFKPEDVRHSATSDDLSTHHFIERLPPVKPAGEPSKGFTGERRDRAGRRMCYRDGKRVPCAKKPPAQAEKPDKGTLAEKIKPKSKPISQIPAKRTDSKHLKEAHFAINAVIRDPSEAAVKKMTRGLKSLSAAEIVMLRERYQTSIGDFVRSHSPAQEGKPVADKLAESIITAKVNDQSPVAVRLKAAVARVPESARAMASRNLGDIVIHKTPINLMDAVRNDLLAAFPEDSETDRKIRESVLLANDIRDLKAGKKTLGTYVKTSMNFHVQTKVDPSRSFSHEFGHAIDGPYLDHSTTPGWQKAFGAELSKGQLTKYGAQSLNEGFAEFCCLVYGQRDIKNGVDVSRPDVEKRFPQCSQFFKENGLWPQKWRRATPKKKDGQADERDGGRTIPLPDGSHIDLFDDVEQVEDATETPLKSPLKSFLRTKCDHGPNQGKPGPCPEDRSGGTATLAAAAAATPSSTPRPKRKPAPPPESHAALAERAKAEMAKARPQIEAAVKKLSDSGIRRLAAAAGQKVIEGGVKAKAEIAKVAKDASLQHELLAAAIGTAEHWMVSQFVSDMAQAPISPLTVVRATSTVAAFAITKAIGYLTEGFEDLPAAKSGSGVGPKEIAGAARAAKELLTSAGVKALPDDEQLEAVAGSLAKDPKSEARGRAIDARLSAEQPDWEEMVKGTAEKKDVQPVNGADRTDAMTDILGGLFGEQALDMFGDKDGGGNAHS